MAYKFAGIDSDKKSLNAKSKKVQSPNLRFGSDKLDDPNIAIEKVMEEHGISHIDVNLIINRNENNFEQTSVITLKRSIRQIGLLSPVLLWETSDKKYTIIAGHRRVSAYREILNDLRNENAPRKEVEKFQTIPAIVFEIVDDRDERLGSDSKYITKETEKLMYQSSNLEVRQINKDDLIKHISYFYEMIKNDEKFKSELLNKRNKGKKRYATKLNIPDTISQIITNDLGFQVSHVYVWQYVTIYEKQNDYLQYYKIAMRRIENGEKLKTVFNDFQMAIEIKDAAIEDKNIKREYLNRLESEREPVINIYNECFNIKPIEKVSLKKSDFIKLLKEIKKGNKTIDEVIKLIEDK